MNAAADEETTLAADQEAGDRQADDTASVPASVRPSLRWWPAAAILALMAAMRFLPSLLEAPPFALMMLGFLGPGLVGGLLLLAWWCFASRATLAEKLTGIAGLLVIAGLSIGLLHYSMKGMGIVIMMLPTGLAAFAVGLVVMSWSPRWRVAVALLAAAVGFGFWDFRQSEGVTGQFEAQLLWRWEPNAEQRYLNELAAREEAPQGSATLQPINLESAAWPSFRGENRRGTVAGVTLQTNWREQPPELIWKRKVGPGWSSFSVAGNRLYTQEQRGETEAVVCLDAETGDALWEHVYPSRFWESVSGAGPRATPTIGRDGVYAFGADGILMRLDASNGAVVWQRDVKEDAAREPPMWGYAASPLLVDTLVVVHAGGEDEKGLFAYQADDGGIAWSVPSGSHSYSSAQLTELCGRRGILMMTDAGLQFLDPATGATIWRYDLKTDNYRALQPLVVDRSIYIATSLQEGTHRVTVQCDEAGDWSLDGTWTSRDMKSEFNDFVHHDGCIYGFDGSIFACIDAESGRRLWKRGRYGNGQVLLFSQSGQLLIATEKGGVVLLKATPEKHVELAEFQAIEGKTWNHPVVVGDRLYIRNAQEAACYRLPVSFQVADL